MPRMLGLGLTVIVQILVLTLQYGMQMVVFVQSSIMVASISFVFSRGITNLFT